MKKRVESEWLCLEPALSPFTINSTFRKFTGVPIHKEKKKQRIKKDFEQKGTFAGLRGVHLDFYSTSDSLPTPPHHRDVAPLI